MKLAQMEDQIQFAQHMKKQLLMNKKHIVIEKEEAERYLKLQEQYVRQAVTIFDLCKIVSSVVCTCI